MISILRNWASSVQSLDNAGCIPLAAQDHQKMVSESLEDWVSGTFRTWRQYLPELFSDELFTYRTNWQCLYMESSTIVEREQTIFPFNYHQRESCNNLHINWVKLSFVVLVDYVKNCLYPMAGLFDWLLLNKAKWVNKNYD